ncbi:multidrug resistance efflux pump [Microvirga flocculans]|uniref:Multidrug resistance efflux pump n=1 Tax=Microvirga flocculans TaxID=217168 RepID=A0A7W6N832_9HYPH|nr:hypothetical protein [Microvirga flocculans]MBB4040768.1 multidrug resistance efflux pump [Microvirga flocculans]
MMSSLANTILFLSLVITSVMVAVMYRKLKKLDRYHAEYRQIFDKTGDALTAAQKAVAGFGKEGKETLTLLSLRIEEAQAAARQLEALIQDAKRQAHSHSASLNS